MYPPNHTITIGALTGAKRPGEQQDQRQCGQQIGQPREYSLIEHSPSS
ncbi:MAG: hypothetical protein KC449_24490 [Anaerolineales bacterium]|nr:hypothetical protein [Anaerolineales bacterium]